MTVKEIQRALKALGLYKGKIDGDAGDRTRAAIDELLERSAVAERKRWAAARRQIAAEQLIMKSAGLEVGAIDGQVGPQTRFARETFAHVVKHGAPPAAFRDEDPPHAEPAHIRPAWPRQADVEQVYGKPGENLATLALPYPLRIAWDRKKTVASIAIHEKVHDAVKRVLERVANAYDHAARQKLGLDLFGGAFNIRKMRGGSRLSMHSWGIAIDFDPDRNQLKWDSGKALLARPDAARFLDLWEEEGFVSLGRARNFDWMHVQAARL